MCLLRYYKNVSSSPVSGGTFDTAGTNSAININSTATSMTTTGSVVIASGYLSSQVRVSTLSNILGGNSFIVLGSNIDNSAQDYVSLSAISLSTTSNCVGSITWMEY